MTMTTRIAAVEDAPQIAALLAHLGYPADSAEVTGRLGYWSADQQSKVIAAVIDDTVAGIAAVHAIPYIERTGWRGRLVALIVDERYRGHGVGRALVMAAEAEARTLGCLDMEITSARERTAAQRFYAALGYTDICGRAARFVKHIRAGAPA
jgi:GNAT superfamily N-acetyltransferase